MEPQWIIAALALGAIIGVVILKVLGGSKNAEPLSGQAENAAPSAGRTPTEAELIRLRDLYRAGEIIQAIKQYREITRCGLKEAKDFADSNFTQVPAAPKQPVNTGDVTNEIRALMQAGQKIEAIKRYREVYGVGLAEAKYAVENLL